MLKIYRREEIGKNFVTKLQQKYQRKVLKRKRIIGPDDLRWLNRKTYGWTKGQFSNKKDTFVHFNTRLTQKCRISVINNRSNFFWQACQSNSGAELQIKVCPESGGLDQESAKFRIAVNDPGLTRNTSRWKYRVSKRRSWDHWVDDLKFIDLPTVNYRWCFGCEMGVENVQIFILCSM